MSPLESTATRMTLAGLGTALPERVVANAEIAAAVGVDETWIVKRTGITERRYAAPSDHLHELAARAGAAALADAGVEARDIDLVLLATSTADEIIPACAPLVANALGADRAGAIDIGGACTGFVDALVLGAAMLETGRAQHVLVVGAEILSRHLDHSDKRTAMLFGDGAGAIVVSGSGPGAVGPAVLGADGALGPILHASRGDGLIRMDGPEVFRNAVARMGDAAVEASTLAGTDIHDLDLLVFHQANARILQSLIERLELDPARVVNAIGEHGNTSAASIPLALDLARRNGLLTDGASVLLAAFGAGLTWGATVVRWGPDAS